MALPVIWPVALIMPITIMLPASVLSDLAIAANVLLQDGVDRVLIFDVDVHQGDGTAALLANE